MTMVRLPRVLDALMRESYRLHPVTVSITENLKPLSTAHMTLPRDELVKIRSFVELYTAEGSAGVYRVMSTAQTYTGETTVELEEAATALGDGIITDEGKYTGTAAQVVQSILNHQADYPDGVHELSTAHRVRPWVVGDMPDVQAEYEYKNNNVLTALIELCESLGDYRITFDTGALPWKVNIVPLEGEATCEGRLSRNLAGVQVTYDESDFCTGIYCPELGTFTYADTMGIYGEKWKTLSAGQDVTQESMDAYIRRYLDEHKHPSVSINVDAVDLAQMTGESLDHFRVGALCRLALPDYGVTLEERIISRDVSSVYGEPFRVRLTLANRLRDTVKDLVELQRQTDDAEVTENSAGTVTKSRGGGSGGGSGSGLTTAKLVELLRATETRVEENTAYIDEARIDLDAHSVRLSASESQIDDVLGDVVTMSSQLSVTAEAITSKVSKGSIISEINQTAEAVRISASKINLDGYVTASQLSASISEIQNGFAYSITTSRLTLGGWVIMRRSQQVVTSVSGRATSTARVTDVNDQVRTVVAGYSVTANTATISYLSWGDVDV